MAESKSASASSFMIIVAFATVYIVWGSTYFFIHKAVQGFPPLLLGAFRFLTAGFLMLIWCAFRGEKLFQVQQIKTAAITGLLLLFVGNGAVIWVEQFLPSALVAILVSAAPLWFVLLDRPKWKVNLSSKATISGLLVGFGGVILLFYENIIRSVSDGNSTQIGAFCLLVFGSICWSGGSLYSKYNSKGESASVNSMWQMLAAGLAFLIVSSLKGEGQHFMWTTVSTDAWLAALYLIFFGSIAGFSAYVWLLDVCSATQVSTYAYVNPVVAVLLGVFFAGESISFLQVSGLVIILFSVLLVNLVKYRQEKNMTLRNKF